MKKMLVVFALISVMSLSAFAFPSPDSIGFYSSITGDGPTTVSTLAPFDEVTLYLILSHPSAGGVSGWECFVDIQGTRLADTWDLAGGTATNPLDSTEYNVFNVGIGIGPQALVPDANGAVLLATYTTNILATTDRVTFAIHGFPGSVNIPVGETEPSGYAVYKDPQNLADSFDMTPNTDGVWETMTNPQNGAVTEVRKGNVCFVINPAAGEDPPVSNTDTTWAGVKSLFR